MVLRLMSRFTLMGILLAIFDMRAGDAPAIAAEQTTQSPVMALVSPAAEPAPSLALLLSVDHINKNPTRKKEFIAMAKNKLAEQDATTVTSIIHLMQLWPDAAHELVVEAKKQKGLSSLLINVFDVYEDGFADEYTSLNDNDGQEQTLINKTTVEYLILPTAKHLALTIINNDYRFGRGVVEAYDKYFASREPGRLDIDDDNADEFLEDVLELRKIYDNLKMPGMQFVLSLPGALLDNAVSLYTSKKMLETANQVTGNYIQCPRYSRRSDNTEYYVCKAAQCAAEQGVAALIRKYVTSPVIGSVLPLNG